jgi:hypothetical protein
MAHSFSLNVLFIRVVGCHDVRRARTHVRHFCPQPSWMDAWIHQLVNTIDTRYISFTSKMKRKMCAYTCVSPAFRLLLTQGSPGVTTCLVVAALVTSARDSSRSITCPMAPAPVSSHRTALDCHMPRGSSSRHQGPRQL